MGWTARHAAAALMCGIWLGSASMAEAQSRSAGGEPPLPALTSADTDEATPDWYRQFTFSPDRSQEQSLWRGIPNQDIGFRWEKGERWQLNIEVLKRSDDTVLPREEMRAGATFNITPRFSVGGSLSVGGDDLDDPSKLRDQQIETGIRLRSAFKF